MVVKYAEDMSSCAIEAVRSSLNDISKVVTTDPQFNPIIRPVLDLTEVEKKAGDISNLLAANPLKLDTSSKTAKDASVGYLNNQEALAENAAAAQGDTLVYNQTNNSPKAINTVEVYRQTKNQLSTVKGALDDK